MIKKWYYIIGLINLIFSICLYFITYDLNLLFVINVGYHMMYWFIGYVPRYQLKFLGTNSPIYDLAYHVIRIFSIIMSLIGLIFIILIIYKSISSNQMVMLFSALTSGGITLGGLSLLFYLKEIK